MLFNRWPENPPACHGCGLWKGLLVSLLMGNDLGPINGCLPDEDELLSSSPLSSSADMIAVIGMVHLSNYKHQKQTADMDKHIRL